MPGRIFNQFLKLKKYLAKYSVSSQQNYTPLAPIKPNALYHWGDAPFYGLEHVRHLELENKRKFLFGRCETQNYLSSEHENAAIVFTSYLNLDCPDIVSEKIFIPAWMLRFCSQFLAHFESNWHWSRIRSHDVTCAMHKARYPRLVTSCWLANHQDDVSFTYTQNWDPQERMSALYEVMQIGGLKDWTNSWGPELRQLPANKVSYNPNGDALNFLELYHSITKHAAACVVISAACWEWAGDTCEKYLIAVYSGCIPLVQGYKIYDSLKKLGFDTFDDIIDTSSQDDKNPITAIWNLWDRNKVFLQHAREIIQRSDIQERLRHNFMLARDISLLGRRSIERLNSYRAQEIFYKNKKDCLSMYTDVLQYFE